MITVDIEKWIDSLKIAIINKDTQSAFSLTQQLPDFNKVENEQEKLESLKIANELIYQTIQLLKQDQDNIRDKINKIKQAKKFFD